MPTTKPVNNQCGLIIISHSNGYYCASWINSTGGKSAFLTHSSADWSNLSLTPRFREVGGMVVPTS
jgi:hypothetical protein